MKTHRQSICLPAMAKKSQIPVVWTAQPATPPQPSLLPGWPHWPFFCCCCTCMVRGSLVLWDCHAGVKQPGLWNHVYISQHVFCAFSQLLGNISKTSPWHCEDLCEFPWTHRIAEVTPPVLCRRPEKESIFAENSLAEMKTNGSAMQP